MNLLISEIIHKYIFCFFLLQCFRKMSGKYSGSYIFQTNIFTRVSQKISKPSFERFQIFNEDLVGVLNKKVNLVLNKPIYVGQAILDLSKRLMYTFHYDVMKPIYGDKINLLFTDTGNNLSICGHLMQSELCYGKIDR